MKSFICAMILFVVILAGTSYYSYRLENAVARLDMQIEKTEQLAKTEEWLMCREVLEEFTKDWEKTHKHLELFIHHKDMDQINHVISAVCSYAEFENKQEFLVQTGILREHLKHIPDSEKLTPENIL